ncbi:dedicator of cytokinesis protein 1-like isoform X2 [Photinus pyralis]|uniref:dedicator of cytokinesis protein 1-like isoform X2 n=1 Tax=Photinus pyralis TaxID=7054 RepID=UPI0012670FE1|nr:dedicator of cytokinesis protein 1-like isoform X2 [Photinus pyralis]
MSEWRSVTDNRCYGIAIYNIISNDDCKLNLTVGETVHILEEEENWYYGYSTSDRRVQGIFPKSYIHITECTIDRSGPNLVFIPQQPLIVHEITTILREWGAHWKDLYVMHSREFERMKNQIYDLIKHRSKIISGTLPVDELKRMTKQITSEIDMGNKLLGLDMIVRDKDGNLIDPEKTSTIQLYYHHKNAAERIRDKRNKVSEHRDSPARTALQQYSHIFVVAVKNFTCKMTEDAELLMTLYDAKENKAITENYVVRWSKDGLMSDLDQMYTLRVMFTDLGKRDLEREKIYLVCYVIRVGSMENKEIDHRRSSMSTNYNKKNCKLEVRKPFGVAAKDITPIMSGKLETDLEQEFVVPFYSCDKDNLDQTLRKFINKDTNKNEGKNQALFVSMKLLHGDLKQVREENPHLILGNISIARKMGFPEVILPGDVRNDLYLTLVCGEFNKGNKTSEKNVEVVVKVCNEKGVAIPGVISLGGGAPPLNEYRSAMYYHEYKPHWCETFKVAIPIEEFRSSHLKFTFKHRSTNEAKDKSEKPFAMSYVRLMQENGTTLKDAKHNLIVYKIDHKKFDDSGLDYFKLPSTVDEIKDSSRPQTNGLSLSTKDSFTISTNICSTKLTQNIDLLGLLNWASHKETLRESLVALMKVDGEEVVKFLQDILDALFNILMDNPESDIYDEMVFDCLLHIISLVSSDWKYQHFEPVLDLYIKESFSATLAYSKLIVVIKNLVDNAISIVSIAKDNILFKAMKALQYIMRFVSRSRLLFRELYPEMNDDSFEESLKSLLHSIVTMMCQTSDTLLREQGACLKYLPSTIPDILKVFNAKQLSIILCDLLKNIPPNRLTKQKMMTINEIVHSKLFLYPECRQILLPVFTKQIKVLFETSEEVELCIKILSDVLDLLFRKDVGSTVHDITEIMLVDLRTVIQSHINMDKENPYSGNLVAIMIDIFRQMTDYHYDKYIGQFGTRTDILDFLMEILLVFKELVNQSVFPSDWCDMIMLQNSVILKSLRFFSHTIRDHFFAKFDNQAWSNFFHCAIAFMTQPALQLETFSHNKRMRIIKRYKDMRRETGFEIRSMWFNLGQYKVQFVPSLVGSILEMTLIPEVELRKATIPIFFDMMQCEFYSSRYEMESYGDTKRDSSHIKANFCDFENEMIAKLDILVEGGRGDEHFKNLFHDIMIDLCSQHTTMKDDGIKFVKMVSRLMERLLEYRSIITDENKENRMSCTVNLLDFYSEINRKEMYIRYVNKLCDLHLECDNHTEAAYTLQLHSNLLNWSDEMLPPLLKSNRYSDCHTHRQLKEALFYNIIDYFDKGKMWECALKKCEELARQYKEETFDYEQLSELHKRMALFYEDIMRKLRTTPEYFKVAYYGRGFPIFLQNKTFIYRGKEYERLADFSSRTLNEYPNAELLNKLTPPGDDILESNGQYIQINHVDPIMDEKAQRFSGKPVANQIVKYYKVNDVQKFRYSRPFTRKDFNIESDNEFASLWLERTILVTTYPLPGILRWFPVSSTNTIEISPLCYAIETMEEKNKDLRDSIMGYNQDKTMPINPLSLKLTGIVDPAVMGGTTNYEEAFFTPEYIKQYPENHVLIQRLKDLIADQIPLLELGIQVHKDRAPTSLLPLQKRLEDCFTKLQENVVEKYGKRKCDLKLDQVTMRRQFSMPPNARYAETTQIGDTGVRSRIPSVTRGQVSSLKHFTATFNFTASTPAANSKSSSNYTSKSSLVSPTKSLTSAPSLTYKNKNKTPKEKRRGSKVETTSTSPNSGAQWYTTDEVTPNGNPVFELRQELTPKRPLRSEVEREKRLSRPPSGQFSRPSSLTVILRTNNSSGNSSNRDSIGTTDSSISEEDLLPPPLPTKSREADYCNLPNNTCENTSFLYTYRNSLRCSSVHTKLPPPEPIDNDDPPPLPPPKPPKNKCL